MATLVVRGDLERAPGSCRRLLEDESDRPTAEVLLLHPSTDGSWLAIGKPGSAMRPGKRIALGEGAAIETLEVLPDGERLCHNDLHHLNIIDHDGRLWLVDWEYGGRGDPLFDLASCICQGAAARSAVAALLSGYGEPLPGSASELEDACWAFDYVRLLWYLAQGTSGSGISADFRAIAAQIERSLEHRMLRA